MLFLLGGLLSAPCNIHPVYSLVPVTTKAHVVREGSHYHASTTLSFRVHEVQAASVASVEPGMLEHIRGHQTIAQRVANSSNGTIETNGQTAAQAKQRLAGAVHEMTADQNRELLREEQAYENVTEYGASQSQAPSYGLPGGPDVHDAACTR
jgi:hypothetical protein